MNSSVMIFWDEAVFAEQTTADRSVPARFSIRKNLQAGADVVSELRLARPVGGPVEVQ